MELLPSEYIWDCRVSGRFRMRNGIKDKSVGPIKYVFGSKRIVTIVSFF